MNRDSGAVATSRTQASWAHNPVGDRMNEIHIVDTTLRDGQLSLWALGMRTGVMLAIAEQTYHTLRLPPLFTHYHRWRRKFKEERNRLCSALGDDPIYL